MNKFLGLTSHLPVLGLIFIILLFIAFATERFPPVTVAVCGAALMISFGWLTPALVSQSFSSSVPIAIGAFFILSGALVRTGAVADNERADDVQLIGVTISPTDPALGDIPFLSNLPARILGVGRARHLPGLE